MTKKPSLKELVKQFQDNDYFEIGYITGIKRIYRRDIEGINHV